ncbi:phosphatidylinositol N-acetylglucosaminyltransferase subunit A [Pycnococcus provasolii]
MPSPPPPSPCPPPFGAHAHAPKGTVLMVTDFFFPNTGGVEQHVYHLSQCLMEAGYRLVVLTHAYTPSTTTTSLKIGARDGGAHLPGRSNTTRGGVRYLTNGLKVYYIPKRAFYKQNVFPTLFASFRLIRTILVRERVDVVHCHQAFSVLAHEATLCARTLAMPVVFTDHSLFGFSDTSSILTNKLLKFTLCDASAVICVSHTSKENTVLRACCKPTSVFVVPNAVDATRFTPPASNEPAQEGIITVVVVSRLVYRKGADLLRYVIPIVCARHARVRFIIAGDGDKRPSLEQAVRAHGLEGRVTFTGALEHSAVMKVMRSGTVFLNCSLTEAFCMAIVEAAACGLVVVSTDVGGVREVLPPPLLTLSASTHPESIADALTAAMARVHDLETGEYVGHRVPRLSKQELHEFVRQSYDWRHVASRTEVVYAKACRQASSSDLLERLQRYALCGPVAGPIFACVAVVAHMYACFLEWCLPACSIEAARTYAPTTTTVS